MKDVECDGKGVRKTHTNVSVMHVKKHESWGVRKENIHYEKSDDRSHHVHYYHMGMNLVFVDP